MNDKEFVEEIENGEAIEEASAEVSPEQDSQEKYLRLLAEFDNYKKRTLKEKAQIYTTAASGVVEAILPLIDNMKRAVSVESTGDAQDFIDGIKLIERQFDDTLKNLGVSEIESVGAEFDPNVHNAVMHVEDAAVDGTNIVVEEFIKGYMYGDTVVRHATVKVAN